MAEPVNPNKLTPFQAAMLKFEQAVRESLEAERAAQQTARQAMMQSSMPPSRQPARLPARQAPGPGARQPGYPAARPAGTTQRAERPMAAEDSPESFQQTSNDQMMSGSDGINGVSVPSPAYSPVTPTVTTSFAGDIARQKRKDSAQQQQNLSMPQYASPLMQGVVWAEVLGPPVSKRRGRGRNGL